MSLENPFASPTAPPYVIASERHWKAGTEARLARRGLLQREVVISRPIDVTIEYFGRGLRDRILVDGVTTVSLLPVLWLHELFEFQIPYAGGSLPAAARLKTVRRSVRIATFEIEIDGQIVYRERNGQPIRTGQ